MSSIYGIQPLKLSEICCQAKIYATLSAAGTLAIQLMLKKEPFFFDRFSKTGRRIALNFNE